MRSEILREERCDGDGAVRFDTVCQATVRYVRAVRNGAIQFDSPV